MDIFLFNFIVSFRDFRYFMQDQFFFDFRFYEVDIFLLLFDFIIVKGVISVVSFSFSFFFLIQLYGFFALFFFVKLYNLVRAVGVFNFLGVRLSVFILLNIGLWRFLLNDYFDVVVCDFLEFGWFISYDYSACVFIFLNDF